MTAIPGRPPGGSRRSWLKTIRGRLQLAFVAGSVLTLGIAGYAIWSFGNFTGAINDVTERSLVAIRSATQFDRTASGIAAAAPALAVAADHQSLDREQQRTLSELTALRGHAQRLHTVPTQHPTDDFAQLLGQLKETLESIYETRGAILNLGAFEAQVLRQAVSLSQQMLATLEPIKSDAGFELSLAVMDLANLAAGDSEEALDDFLNVQLANFQYSLELEIVVREATSLLHQTLSVSQPQRLDRLQADFERVAESLRRDVGSLGSKEVSTELGPVVARLVDLGVGRANPFDLRRRKLRMEGLIDELSTRANALVAQLRETASAQTNTVMEAARQQSARVREMASRGSLLVAGLALVALVLALLIGWVVVRRGIVDRLTALRDTMVAGRDGDYDAVDISTRGDDEIADMSRALVFFVDSLRQSLQERIETERVVSEARDSAEQANRMKGDFLANMSHEIRTPMNAIIGLTHLALNTDLDDRQRDYLNKTEVSAKALLGIINDILDFSKIEAGKLDVEEIPFDIHSEVLENLSSVIGLKAGEKGTELIFDFDFGMSYALVGDPLRLGQILINLMNNAVKFTDAGEITLSIRVLESSPRSTMLRFEVCDSGIGMSKDQCAGLFQPFSQADTSTTRQYGGTGLGLAISKRLVELMGGEIGVTSEPGQGSTFWFTARFGIADEADVLPVQQPRSDVGELRVLVVDDNPTARVILCRYLNSFGFEVVEVDSAVAALRQLEGATAEPFDLVLSDWKMPEMDGVELLQRIKSDSRLARAPAVLMVTAYDRDRLLDASAEISPDGVLIKPVSPSTLLDGILGVFGKRVGTRHRSGTQALAEHVRGARVLLVEDNEINQQVAREILEGVGVSVTVAGNGREGVDMLKARPDWFDCVLMDIQMPVMDGYQATREIRRESRFRDLPVIAMTANAMASDRERAIAVGMNDHVAKPVDIKELYQALERWIEVPEPRRRQSPKPVPPTTDNAADGRSDDLATLEGIDTEAGLARVVGNEKLYRNILSRFRDSQADIPAQISVVLGDGDTEHAQRLAHTLKGVAGNIGAQRVAESAQVLEQALRAGRTELGEELAAVSSELAAVLPGLAGIDADCQPPPVADAPDQEQVGELLGHLRALLEEDDAEASEPLERLQRLLADTPMAPQLRMLSAAVSEFDFDTALAQLPEVETRCRASLTEAAVSQ